MENTQSFCKRLQESRLPRYDELPTLELYKDQIVSLTNSYLAAFFLEEKPITDTMVNNYVKLKVILPPVKKRYHREHLAQLMLTCLLKKVLSIAEVRQLLECQSCEGAIQPAYDCFCAELERAVKTIVGGKMVWQQEGEESDTRSQLINHAIYSFVHKLYFEITLASLREKED